MTPSQLKELTLIQKGINRLEKRLEKVRYQINDRTEHQTEQKLYNIGCDLGSVSGQIGNIIENNEG